MNRGTFDSRIILEKYTEKNIYRYSVFEQYRKNIGKHMDIRRLDFGVFRLPKFEYLKISYRRIFLSSKFWSLRSICRICFRILIRSYRYFVVDLSKKIRIGVDSQLYYDITTVCVKRNNTSASNIMLYELRWLASTWDKVHPIVPPRHSTTLYIAFPSLACLLSWWARERPPPLLHLRWCSWGRKRGGRSTIDAVFRRITTVW